MVNIVYTFVGTLFIQMWSIFIHLRVIYTILVDFYTFEGSFILVGIYKFEGPTDSSSKMGTLPIFNGRISYFMG